MALSSIGKDIWFSSKKVGFDSRWGYNWGYSITAITMVLQIINWSSILHISTKNRKTEYGKSLPGKHGSFSFNCYRIVTFELKFWSIRSTARMLPCHGRDESSILS